jgi:spore coat-associated protein N
MSIKTKLVMLTAVSALGATMVAGGSFALFTKNATNGTTFASGILTIDDFTGSVVQDTMLNFMNLAPGDYGSKKITVKNTGSLDAWVAVNAAASQGSGDLFKGSTPIQLTYDTRPVRVAKGDTVSVTVNYKMPLSANSDYENKSGSVNVVVDAVQARNNEKEYTNTDGSKYLAPYYFPSNDIPVVGLAAPNPAALINDASATFGSGGYVTLYFKSNESIDLNPQKIGNVIVRYGTISDNNHIDDAHFTEALRANNLPIVKNKIWDGFLNSGPEGNTIKYPQGATQTLSYKNLLPANTEISTQVNALVSDNPLGDSTWYTTLHDHNGYVRVELIDDAGNKMVQFVRITN